MRYLLCGVNAKYIHSNPAIFSLKAYAEKFGPKTARILLKEYTINHQPDAVLEDIYEAKADVVIFSCYIWNISFVKELAEEIRQICPGTAVWAGGPEVSYDAKRFLCENPAVNLIMLGEGEETFTALVRLSEEGLLEEELMAVPGVAFQEPDTESFRSTGFAPAMDLDRIPFPYDDFSLFSHRILYYESSRGCPYACTYCLSSIDRHIRFRSLSIVCEELQKFLDARVDQVKFVDRTFNCDKHHAMTIWRYLTDHDNGVTNFHFEIAADLLDEEMLDLFARMRPGLIQVEIGVQSTNPDTIAAIHRRMNLNAVFSHVDRIHKMGKIHQHLDLIAGLPKESYERFQISFNDLYVHKPDQLQLGFLKVLKGTPMEAEALDYELKYRSRPPYEVLATKWMDYDDMIRLKGIEEMVEIYYNSGQFACTLQYALSHFPGPFAFYEEFSSYYRGKGLHKMQHNRLEKYAILRDFLRSRSLKLPFLDEVLLLDLYLRENVKSRPAWAKPLPETGTLRNLYRLYGEELFPEDWEAGCYDPKKAAGHSHLEQFSFDAARLLKETETGDKTVQKKTLPEKPSWCLFDYRRRNPLNHNASIKTFIDIF